MARPGAWLLVAGVHDRGDKMKEPDVHCCYPSLVSSGVPDLGSRSAEPPIRPIQPSVVVKTASKQAPLSCAAIHHSPAGSIRMNHLAPKTTERANSTSLPAAMRLERRRLLGFAASVPALSLAAACSSLEQGMPTPESIVEQATVLGIPNARFWPDIQGQALAREAIAAQQRER